MARWTSIEADRDALADHVAQACAAATLARPATVKVGVIDGEFPGPFPLVEVIFDVQTMDLIPKSNYSDMAQSFATPGRMIIRIRSATSKALGIGPNDAERELYRVHAAVLKWFAVVAHRSLPDAAGTPRASFCGPPFTTKGTGQNGPYALVDGALGQVLAFSVTFLGLGLEST